MERASTSARRPARIVYAWRASLLRQNKAYGILVRTSTGSTDGQMVNVDVGLSGLNGIGLQASAQILSNVHVWQSGRRRRPPPRRRASTSTRASTC